jgi:hypothetical protein
VNALIKIPSKLARLMAIDNVDSEHGKERTSELPPESSKQSEIAMYVEMTVALAALVGVLVLAGWIWYLGNTDWIASIHRFQEMI